MYSQQSLADKWLFFCVFNKKNQVFAAEEKSGSHKREVLKIVCSTFLLVCFSILKDSTCETWKNIFYFTLKALVILEKIRFWNFSYSHFIIISNA